MSSSTTARWWDLVRGGKELRHDEVEAAARDLLVVGGSWVIVIVIFVKMDMANIVLSLSQMLVFNPDWNLLISPFLCLIVYLDHEYGSKVKFS